MKLVYKGNLQITVWGQLVWLTFLTMKFWRKWSKRSVVIGVMLCNCMREQVKPWNAKFLLQCQPQSPRKLCIPWGKPVFLKSQLKSHHPRGQWKLMFKGAWLVPQYHKSWMTYCRIRWSLWQLMWKSNITSSKVGSVTKLHWNDLSSTFRIVWIFGRIYLVYIYGFWMFLLFHFCIFVAFFLGVNKPIAILSALVWHLIVCKNTFLGNLTLKTIGNEIINSPRGRIVV